MSSGDITDHVSLTNDNYWISHDFNLPRWRVKSDRFLRLPAEVCAVTRTPPLDLISYRACAHSSESMLALGPGTVGLRCLMFRVQLHPVTNHELNIATDNLEACPMGPASKHTTASRQLRMSWN
jgi:hypothetical protein